MERLGRQSTLPEPEGPEGHATTVMKNGPGQGCAGTVKERGDFATGNPGGTINFVKRQRLPKDTVLIKDEYERTKM